jgi:hypothetical protein
MMGQPGACGKARTALADRGCPYLGVSNGRKRQAQTPPGRGVHAALARQWVDLSPPRMWVLPDSSPACRRPTIACMGFFDDVPAPSLRLRESESAGPVLYPFAAARGPHWVRLPVGDAATRGISSLTPG